MVYDIWVHRVWPQGYARVPSLALVGWYILIFLFFIFRHNNFKTAQPKTY